MAQGKLKVKTQLPKNVKGKTKQGNVSRKSKPAKPGKKNKEVNKFQKQLTKAINKTIEADVRARAESSNHVNLSKAQKAVVKHHQKKKAEELSKK